MNDFLNRKCISIVSENGNLLKKQTTNKFLQPVIDMRILVNIETLNDNRALLGENYYTVLGKELVELLSSKT